MTPHELYWQARTELRHAHQQRNHDLLEEFRSRWLGVNGIFRERSLVAETNRDKRIIRIEQARLILRKLGAEYAIVSKEARKWIKQTKVDMLRGRVKAETGKDRKTDSQG